jgi:hypothetical protein
MRTPELSGVTIVGAGSFNPAIVHPQWLADKRLIDPDVAQHALEREGGPPLIVSPQLASFAADWLVVQVTKQQAILSTVDEGRELDLRDLAKGVFDLLPETPVDALGINADAHFRVDNEAAWHAFGDRFLPKEFWEPLFEGEDWKVRPDGKHRVGTRVMTVEANRNDKVPGYVRVELAPSVRISPNGVYVGINAHFQLTKGERRANAAAAAAVLTAQWNAVRAQHSRLMTALMEAV